MQMIEFKWILFIFNNRWIDGDDLPIIYNISISKIDYSQLWLNVRMNVYLNLQIRFLENYYTSIFF